MTGLMARQSARRIPCWRLVLIFVLRCNIVCTAILVSVSAWAEPSAVSKTYPEGGLESPAPPQESSQLLIRGIKFSGNHGISSARLTAILPALPAPVDFTTLETISGRITQYYRSHGYPFAQSYFPPQKSRDGVLLLEIAEGQYGKITVENTSGLSSHLAQRIIETNLCGKSTSCSGTPIKNNQIQRASLLLADQPGVLAAGTFQRGETFGTSDFDVVAKPGRRFQFDAGVDNFGTPTTGRWRGSLDASANELLGRGDQLNLNFVGSGEELWNGTASYSLLLSPSGLRGGISGGRTHYELGGAFRSLDVNGYANTVSVFLTYPVVRTLAENLNVGLAYQHKSLHDNIGVVGYDARHLLDNGVASLSGNLADNLLGGGFNELSASFVYGDVHGLDANTFASDQDPQYGLFTKGHFHKFTFSVDRQQNLPGPFSLYGVLTGQVANKNLTSAEQFYVGGPAGVRAYPVGEGSADTGLISTLELRYTILFKPLPGSILTLASFYDNGWIRRNQDPPPGTTDNTADYGGAGFRIGLAKQDRYSLNLVWAHRIGGESSQIDVGKNSNFWLQAAFYF